MGPAHIILLAVLVAVTSASSLIQCESETAAVSLVHAACTHSPECTFLVRPPRVLDTSALAQAFLARFYVGRLKVVGGHDSAAAVAWVAAGNTTHACTTLAASLSDDPILTSALIGQTMRAQVARGGIRSSGAYCDGDPDAQATLIVTGNTTRVHCACLPGRQCASAEAGVAHTLEETMLIATLVCTCIVLVAVSGAIIWTLWKIH